MAVASTARHIGVLPLWPPLPPHTPACNTTVLHKLCVRQCVGTGKGKTTGFATRTFSMCVCRFGSVPRSLLSLLTVDDVVVLVLVVLVLLVLAIDVVPQVVVAGVTTELSGSCQLRPRDSGLHTIVRARFPSTRQPWLQRLLPEVVHAEALVWSRAARSYPISFGVDPSSESPLSMGCASLDLIELRLSRTSSSSFVAKAVVEMGATAHEPSVVRS